MEKMYYISYGKKIDRAVYCKKILDMVPVSFLILKTSKYLEDLSYCKLRVEKDKNQRMECGCMESVEIRTCNTCKNGCKYCYIQQFRSSEMH